MKSFFACLAVALVVPVVGVAGEATLPDLDVTHISRTPRYPGYEVEVPAAGEMQGIPRLKPGTERDKRRPDEGEQVTFTAHVVNKGRARAPKFAYVWKLDGKAIGRGTMGPIGPGETATAGTTWAWTMQRHEIEFVADSENAVEEAYETNNARKDVTDALALLVAVHRTTYEAFNAVPNVVGTRSFEDWVQFHVETMNVLFERSRSELARHGILDRVRVDAFVVGDREEEEAIRRGVDVAWRAGERADCAQWAAETDYSLLREWARGLGMIDTTILNVECWNNTVRGLDGARVRLGHDFSEAQTMMHSPGPNLFCEGNVLAMNAQRQRRRGFSGDFLYAIPEQNIICVLDRKGKPVPYAGVAVYQWDRSAWSDPEGPEPIAVGTTSEKGEFVLPNRPCPTVTTAQGFALRPNPFGRINVDGSNGLLLLRVQARRQTDFLWMEIFEFNRQYHAGNAEFATYEIATWLPEEGAPLAPLDVQGTTTGRQVTLEWKPARSPDVVGYTVYGGASADYGYKPVASGVGDLKWGGTLLQSDASLSKTYRYVVTAVDARGKESAFSTSYTTPLLVEVRGVAVDSTGRRIVADAFYHYVLAQEADGDWVGFLSETSWGGVKERPGAALLLEDVAVDSRDRIVALNAPDEWDDLAGFTIFGNDGEWIKTVGTGAEGGFKTPKGIAVGPGDVIVVADTGHHRVQVFDKDGAFLRAFGTRGSGDGEFESPEGVAVATDGTIYVTDTGNNRVQVFTPEGEFVEVLSDLALKDPRDVDVGPDGTIYIASTGNNAVLVLPKGDVTKKWTLNDAGGKLNGPVGVSVDATGNIIIADSGNKRITVFKAEDRSDLEP